MTDLPFDDDPIWRHWQDQWALREDTNYLNYGSFGPPPLPVRAARRHWQDQLDCQPMDFFMRQYEPAWREAREETARFIGTRGENLVFMSRLREG